MEITNILGKIANYTQNRIQEDKVSKKPGQRAEQPESDRVKVSEEAVLAKKTEDLSKEAPEVRQEKVSQLKEQIQKGEYQPNSHTIAKKILEQDLDLWF